MTNQTKIIITANADQAKRELGGFSTTLEGVGKKILSFSGIASALSIGAFATKLVSVQREFDILNSSLITVTGSSENAKQEFAWIKEFASETPYQLTEVTGAFIKMKALGLDASRDALISYGNTASAMGKDLNQMIEAVADAATGEFERLKEFGIKARKNGDDVAFTFRGVTTTVRNSASEITGYLQGLGNNDFAGAMALRAGTLDGAISNLADTWDGLFRTINDGNAGGLIYDSIKLATGAVKDLDKILASLNETTQKNNTESGVMKFIQEALATVFETLAVLGINLKYVLVQIGAEIGGIAAQAGAVLRGEFAQAAQIHRQMVADAEAARKEVDAASERILTARSKVVIAPPPGGGTPTISPTSGAGPAQKNKTSSFDPDGDFWSKVDDASEKNRLKARADAERDFAQAAKEANNILANVDPIAKANAEWQKLLDLQQTLGDEFPLTAEQMGQAYQKAMGDMGGATDQMTIYAQRAGENIQGIFSEFLFDPFKGGVDGMLADFSTMLQRMAAEALASQILGSIGDWGKTGGGAGTSLGGIAAAVFGGKSFDGGGYTGNAPRVGGLDGRGGFLAMMHPQETVTDHAKGQRAGGVNVVNNFVLSQPADRRTQEQIAAMAGASIQTAMARNG